MKYISTRSADEARSFGEILLDGLAPDGGLYVPETWPTITLDEQKSMRGRSFAAIAGRVLAPFLLDADLSDADLAQILDRLYGPKATLFTDPRITPLVPLAENEYLLELFHGPTLAFKDVALQFLGALFAHYCQKSPKPLTIIGATSGDTGSAAIAACADIPDARIFILHPRDRVSDIQRRQMTTHPATNVYNLAIDGTFDDCQKIVKTLFADADLTQALGLTAINSINWARIAMQIAYYFYAATQIPEGHIPHFVVPTGNFGNIYAGYVARQMGLPMGRLIIANNRNDILYRFMKTGEMATDRVTPSLSPSMDIQISSNFERFLFDLVGRNYQSMTFLLDKFKLHGTFKVSMSDHLHAQEVFAAGHVDDDQTLATIRRIHKETGMVIDPHTAVGIHVGREFRNLHSAETGPFIMLACAHPAKFPDTVTRAIGNPPAVPERLKPILSAPERLVPMVNNSSIIGNYIRGIVGA